MRNCGVMLRAILCMALIFPVFCHAASPVPDTGQTTSYTDTFGEDADYTINPPSYTKLGQGGVELADTATLADGWIMVRDNVTGLIWEVKTDDNSIHDRDNKYTWTNTATFITAVNSESFGGFSDWRLPTVNELSTLVNSNRYNPAINTEFFPGTVSSRYWSSTALANSRGRVWYVDFYSGLVNYHLSHSESGSYYVRAVRAGQ